MKDYLCREISHAGDKTGETFWEFRLNNSKLIMRRAKYNTLHSQ